MHFVGNLFVKKQLIGLAYWLCLTTKLLKAGFQIFYRPENFDIFSFHRNLPFALFAGLSSYEL